MEKRWIAWGTLITCLLAMVGCSKPSNNPAKAPAKADEPKKPLPPLSVTTAGLNIRVFDEKGQVVLVLKAKSAGASQSDQSSTVMVRNGQATLYQNNVATATMTADALSADQDKRIIVATGNVILHSLTQKGSPTVRADRMIWQHDKNLLTGTGNVVVTAEPAYTLYAKSFVADTKLSDYRVELGDTPATGSF